MSDFEKFAIAFLLIVGTILAVGFSYKIGNKLGYKVGYDAALNLPHKPDTVWRDTTIFRDRLVEKIKWKDKPVYIPVPDSVLVHHYDTTYVPVPMENKIYEDTLFRAQVSGYNPNLDWIEIHQKTAYITNTIVQKKRWSFSITAGPGVVYNQNGLHGGAAVVVGGSYNF